MKAINFYDKFMPTQQEFLKFYSGENYYKELYKIIFQSSNLIDPYKEFKIILPEEFTQEDMGSNPLLLKLLEFLIKLINAKNILEIGTFIGVASMVMSKASGFKSKIVTIEKYDKFGKLAELNFKNNNFSNIELKIGDALSIIDELPYKYDFIFLDGNKESYRDYFIKLDKKLDLNGIFVVDDVLFHGDVLNKNQETKKGKGVKKFLMEIENRKNYLKLMLPISNGIMIMKKIIES